MNDRLAHGGNTATPLPLDTLVGWVGTSLPSGEVRAQKYFGLTLAMIRARFHVSRPTRACGYPGASCHPQTGRR